MTNTARKGFIGRLLVAATFAITATMAAGISTAAADQPTTATDSVTFPATNPCTGSDHMVTLNFEFRDHVGHENNFVGHSSRTGTTDDGYVMNNGVENFVANKNVVRGTFTDQWRHPDGSKFRVKGVYVERQGEVVVDKFSVSCIGN